MQNTLKYNEWWRIWVWKTFKIERQDGGPNNSDILENWFPLEIRLPLFNLQKFHDPVKSLPDSCRMYWNIMNDEEFWSKKLLKLKTRRGDQIIQTFCKIGSPQKLGPPSLICRNLRLSEKPSSFMHNGLKSNEWWRIWLLRTFKIEIQKGGTK